MVGRARTTGRVRVFALAAVVLAVFAGTLPGQAPQAEAAPLVPGTDFSISSTISSSPTSPSPPALLYLGVTRYLWYAVTNPLPQPITVTTLGIDRVDAPAACSASNLDLGDPTFTGSFVVPAGATSTVPAPKPITLVNHPTINQDACKNVTFTFQFSGSARVSDAPEPAPKVATATVVATAPTAVALGGSVAVTAKVSRSGDALTSSGTLDSLSTPTGSVSFYSRSASGRQTLLGTGTLDANGTATLQLTSLPAGDIGLYAVYDGTDVFAGSTSPITMQAVIAPPPQCTGTYTTSIIGRPASPVIKGTRGNDFIYAVGADYRIKSLKGDDCVVVGDGNNIIRDGSGSDVVIAGNGRNTIKVLSSRNTIVVGNGAGNKITVKGTKKRGSKVRRNSSANRITVGDGAGTRITVRKGNRNQIAVGDGDRNRIRVRKGKKNVLSLGDGSSNRIFVRRGYKNLMTVGDGDANRIRVRKGNNNRMTVGDGSLNRAFVRKGNRNRIVIGDGEKNLVKVKGVKNRVTLGMGRYNKVTARRGGTRARCILPIPPRDWRGSAARYYRDSLTRCRVVTR